MVKYSIPLDETFGALAHPVRRAILTKLSAGEATVTELAAPYKLTLPAMLKHIRILEKAGLLKSEKTGRVHSCQLNAKPLQEAANWLAFYQKYWNQKLDALGEYLEKSND